ncbi:MAG: esterase/lipase family protein, partial [Myxococcota bacterium]
MARGVSHLAFDAVEQLTNLVEAMHANIAAAPLPLGEGTDGRTRGVTGFVYHSIRFVNAAARAALDGGLALLAEGGEPALPRPRSDALLSALNGVLGDYLEESGNPLAIPMQLRRGGETLALERAGLAAALPGASGKLLVLVHGSCMNDRQWTRNGHDHGAALGRDLGFTPLYLLYNSGRHVSENGRELALLLEALVGAWPTPVEELVIVGHSMGGLVARSACRQGAEADHAWLRRLGKLAFLGTPHHGAPLERGGSWLDLLLGVSPYSAPLARLGMIRSAGITDLRYG